MAHEGVDSTVSSVHSSSVLGGFVDGNVFNKQRINIERFQFSVGFSISQKFQQVFAGLFGPSTLRGFETGARGELFGLSASTGRFVVSEEGNTSFVFDDVLQVLLSLSEIHAFEHFGRFSGVFEVDSDVVASSFARFGGVFGFGHVFAHFWIFWEEIIFLGKK